MKPEQKNPESLPDQELDIQVDTRSDEEKEKYPRWDGASFITVHPEDYIDGKDPGMEETIARYRKRQAEGKPAFYD